MYHPALEHMKIILFAPSIQQDNLKTIFIFHFIRVAFRSSLWQHKMINGNGKWPEEDWVITKKEKKKSKTWDFMNQKISSRISKWNLFRVVLSSYAAFNIFHPSCSAILQLLASITQWLTKKTSSPFLCFTTPKK